MNKKFDTTLSISDLSLSVISSLLLILVYNFRTICGRFEIYFRDQNFYSAITNSEILIFSAEIIAAFLNIFLILLILSFSKKLLKISLIVIFLLSTISLYVLNKFGIIFDEIMLANALTSVGHINEVVDYSLIFYLLLGWLLPIYLILKVKLSDTKKRLKLILLFCIITAYGLAYIALPKFINKTFIIYSPINYIGSTYKHIERFHQQLKQAKNRIDLNQLYDFNYQQKVQNLNVVLIIGESLRADHTHINGYQRQTTPKLETVKNLLHYVARASFNTTTPSVTSMLSHRTKKDFIDIPPEKSIVSVFKNLGFKTYWYSAQSSKEFTNGMLNIMANEANEYFFVDKLQTLIKANQKVYDKDLIPFFDKAIKGDGNKFIILHSFGSHIRFKDRSPENFKIFKPECNGLPSSCKRELVVNSYDNSVVYTDDFIYSIIQLLKNTNSILFYISDHGVFLGEKNVYANGNSSQINDDVHIVPMFVYMSDPLLKNEFYKQKFLTAGKKQGSKNLSHDNLFDSIIDCSGIKSELLKRNLSLCK